MLENRVVCNFDCKSWGEFRFTVVLDNKEAKNNIIIINSFHKKWRNERMNTYHTHVPLSSEFQIFICISWLLQPAGGASPSFWCITGQDAAPAPVVTMNV